MKIFIDIGHPAHVHYFRNFIKIMEAKGHEFFISARDRYPVKELLEHYKIDFYNRGKGKNSVLGKLYYLVLTDIKLLIKALKFKPSMLISFNGPYTTHVGKLLNKPSIVFDDTDSASLSRKFYKPFASHILNPDVFKHDLGEKQIKFKGYMELSYLHPKYFKPDISGNEILGIKEGEDYVIIRFVNWNAHHDYGHNGISEELKYKAVKEFSKYAKVFITSENILPDELEKYRINIDPVDMHKVLRSAMLLFGESATMASECAVLGVPAIFIDNDGRSYTDEEESRYNIVFNFNESDNDVIKAIDKGVEVLKEKRSYDHVKSEILSEKISLTDYLVWFAEEYPNSAHILKNDANYQNKFIINK